MAESYPDPSDIDPIDIDPRTDLADMFRDFLLSAIVQQKAADGLRTRRARRKKSPAGSLFKTEDGWLKVSIQPSTPDRRLNDVSGVVADSEPTLRVLPELWVQVPLAGIDTARFALEDIVLASEDLYVFVLMPGVEPIELLVRDNYHGPRSPSFESPDDLLKYIPPAEEEQILSARTWTSTLVEHGYDIRTIESSQSAA